MGFGLKMNRVPKAEINAKVTEASRILQLDDYLQRNPKALSGGQRQRVDKHIRHYWQQLGNDCLCGPSCFRLCASDPNDEGGTLVRFIQPWGISLLHFSHTQLLATVADTPCKRIYVCLLMSLRSRAHSSIGQVCHQGRAGCGQLDPRCRARLR